MRRFAVYARVHSLLAGYREKLMDEAYQRGRPVVCHPWLYYPSDYQARAPSFISRHEPVR